MYVPAYHYGEGGKQKGGAIKNSVDMFLCINAMKMLYSHPNIQTFVLVTGDRDFVPLIKTIREFGKRAVVIGVAGAASAHLAQSADEFFFYHQITDNLKPPEKEKPRIRDPYDTLVDAVKLARQRGYVATLASLKLLMAELMGEFVESKYKDGRGKPIQKFKDFVKEAERRNKVKLFSTGTINEVFLPNEDPRKTSRFVEELLPPAEPVDEVDEPEEAEEESKVEVEVSKDQWKMFINAMSPLDGPVPFVRVFDVLRGLRNQGLLDLSNKEVKAMIIQAIHLNLLNRSNRGRGRRTFYQLSADPKVLSQYVELPAAPPTAERAETQPVATEASIMEAQIAQAMEPELAQPPESALEAAGERPTTVYDMDPATSAPAGTRLQAASAAVRETGDSPPAEPTPAHHAHAAAAEDFPPALAFEAEPPVNTISQHSAAPLEFEAEPPDGVVSEDVSARHPHVTAAAESAASSETSARPAGFEPLAAEPVKHERVPAPRVRRGRGRPPAAKYVTFEMGEPALDTQPREQDNETTQPPAEAQGDE
jgi:hypothetical protein